MIDLLWPGFGIFGAFIGSVVGLTRCVESPNVLSHALEITAKPMVAVGLYGTLLVVLLENVPLPANYLSAAVTGAWCAALAAIVLGTALAVRRSAAC